MYYVGVCLQSNSGLFHCIINESLFAGVILCINSQLLHYFSEEPFAGNVESVRMGEDVLASLASAGTLNAFKTRAFWTSIKSAGYGNYC